MGKEKKNPSGIWKTLFAVSFYLLLLSVCVLCVFPDVNTFWEACKHTDYVDTDYHKNEVIMAMQEVKEFAGESWADGRTGMAEKFQAMVKDKDYVCRYENTGGNMVLSAGINGNAYSYFKCYYAYLHTKQQPVFRKGPHTNRFMKQYDIYGLDNTSLLVIAWPDEVLASKEHEWDILCRLAYMFLPAMLISLVLLCVSAVRILHRGVTAACERSTDILLFHVLLSFAGICAGVYYMVNCAGWIWRQGIFMRMPECLYLCLGIHVCMALVSACFWWCVKNILALCNKAGRQSLLKELVLCRMVHSLWEGHCEKKREGNTLFQRMAALLTGSTYYPYGIKKCQDYRRVLSAVLLVVTMAMLLVSGGVLVYCRAGFLGGTPYRDISMPLWAVMGFFFLSCILFLVLVLHLYSGRKVTKKYLALEDQIRQIYDGNYDTASSVDEHSPFAKAHRQLADVGNGLEKSLSEKIHAERMKIDLVTNVSHDLKTPLTSIISYIALLADEELPKQAEEYVGILKNKADRLKDMITDLFELAKATSGEIVMEKSNLDMQKLVIQLLADMEDKIKLSGRQLRTEIPDVPVMVYNDGGKLYRILQNLLDNALKYSMEHTRIYLKFEKTGEESCRISILNTANYEMTFTEEEVFERFYRADKSRSSQGSGLGLSIARGFAKACGGELSVHVDGDSFKVILDIR